MNGLRWEWREIHHLSFDGGFLRGGHKKEAVYVGTTLCVLRATQGRGTKSHLHCRRRLSPPVLRPSVGFRNHADRDYRYTFTFEAKDMCFRINFPSRRKKSRVEGEIAIGACYVFIADRSAVCMVSLVSRHYWISRAWLNQTNQSCLLHSQKREQSFSSLLQKLGKRKGSCPREAEDLLKIMWIVEQRFRGSVTRQDDKLSMILQLYS